MNEKPPNAYEEEAEHIPTLEEVEDIFVQLIGEGKYEDVQKRSDEKGLYYWEVVVDGPHGHVEYSYMRKGRFKEGIASENAIYVTEFNDEGIPTSGHLAAEYRDGQWVLLD